MTNVTPVASGAQGSPAPTKFSPSPDQTSVRHLKLTVRSFARISKSTVQMFVICGNVGFPIQIEGEEVRDFDIGESLIAEYPKGSNPLNTPFSAIYPAEMKPEPKKEVVEPKIIEVAEGLSMTSLEIAALVESRHDSVRRSIERLAERGVIQLPPMEEVKDFQSLSPNSKAKAYRFNGEKGKRDSIVVVAQLSPEFTAKLVDRWQELEKQLAQPKPPAELSRMDILQLAMESEQARIKAETERNEAVRTKALIGSRREATALASASKAKREADRLRHELGRNSRHATITAVEKATGTKFPRNAYVAMRRWCAKNGVSPAEVTDARYGLVKAWPAGAWMDCHDIDLGELFGHDCLDLVIAENGRHAERREVR